MGNMVLPVLLFLGILGFSAGTMPALAANGFVVEARRALASVAVTEPEPPNLPDPAQYLLYKQIDKANATDNAVVGHRIHLGGFCKKASDNTDVPPPANADWFWCYVSERPGWRHPEATAKYDDPPLQKKATLAPPPPPDTRFQHFNWYNGGSITGEPVSIGACLTLNPGADTQEILEAPPETIRLYAPRLESLKGTPSHPSVKVDPETKAATFYKDITVVVKMVIPKANELNNLNGTGIIGFMQTVTGHMTRTNRALVPPTATKNFLGEYACDQREDKPDALLRNPSGNDRCLVTAGREATFNFWDRPSVLPPITAASYQCDFRCFSMYKPDGDRSIWVPVGRVDWDFKAEAKLQANNKWVVTPAPPPGAPPPKPNEGRQCESPPEWEHGVWDEIFKWK